MLGHKKPHVATEILREVVSPLEAMQPAQRTVARPNLEVADIFRTHGPAWRVAQVGT